MTPRFEDPITFAPFERRAERPSGQKPEDPTRSTRLGEQDAAFLQWCGLYRLKPSGGLRAAVALALQAQAKLDADARARTSESSPSRRDLADFLNGRTEGEVEVRVALAELVGEIEASSYGAAHGFALRDATAFWKAKAALTA